MAGPLYIPIRKMKHPIICYDGEFINIQYFQNIVNLIIVTSPTQAGMEKVNRSSVASLQFEKTGVCFYAFLDV